MNIRKNEGWKERGMIMNGEGIFKKKKRVKLMQGDINERMKKAANEKRRKVSKK